MAKLKLEGKFLEIVRVIAYVEFIVESESLTSDKLISYISEHDFFEYQSSRRYKNFLFSTFIRLVYVDDKRDGSTLFENHRRWFRSVRSIIKKNSKV